jgi:N,N'-diacetyllegionaminate synthase
MINKTIIIAEAGVNHNGSLVLAKKLIDVAAVSGADYVKFQTFKTELNISKTAKKADYQKHNTFESEETQFEMVKKLELSFNDFKELKKYCDIKNIGFLSTGFDSPSLDFLNDIGQLFFKIPSGEITNKPYLQYIARKNKPVVMSTGMADLNEIRSALDVLLKEGLILDQITLLHCNTEYPTPMTDVNLKAMITIKKTFKTKIGYSDHTLGIEVPIAAVALGATVIEKHFTLDRNLPGPDHKASLQPDELKAMVTAIRNVEIALAGSGYKKPSQSEIKNIEIARKSIHAAVNIPGGTKLESRHLIMKRPGNGISPMEMDLVIGKTLNKDILADTQIAWGDFL